MIDYNRIETHLKNAKEKHPVFCETLVNESMTTESVRETLDIARHLEPTAQNILDEEIWEVYEAYLEGDIAHAVDECYDAIAVLLRMIETMENEK